jgi:SAM-dependent methyltransferase
MTSPGSLRCPVCGGVLDESDPERLTCSVQSESFPRVDGVYDLRLHRDLPVEASPVRKQDLETALQAQNDGRPYVESLEAFLRGLEEVEADRFMQILGEGRGAWFTVLESVGSDLLFLGNALSGTVPALAIAGFRVTALDTSPERARFGQWRNASHGHAQVRSIVAGATHRLPFADEAFDVIVAERGFPRASPRFGHDLDECRRVCRGEIAFVGNNRLGYKRSTGRRSIHYVPGPLEYALGALWPTEGERTIVGFRRALAAPGFGRARAFALYPHATDFTHVVSLDSPRPALTIGPKEKRNLLKIAAVRAGLFSWLAPSFLLVARREENTRGRNPTEPPGPVRIAPPGQVRIDRILLEIAEHVGEPCPEVEHVVSTRGQSIVVHTRPRDRRAGDVAGRWTLHVPLSPLNIVRAPRRNAVLASVRSRFPWLPTPEPLFHGRADGVLLSCERRLPGWTAPQHSGDRGRITRILAEVASHFARLLVRPAAPFTDREFDELLATRFDLVASKAGVPSTVSALERLREETRARLVGRSIPRVLYHSDLRDKHLQIGEDGSVIGYLDWSTSEEEFLPYQDVLNLVVHARRQDAGVPIREAWRVVRERREMLAYEREPLERYATAVGIDDETTRAIEACYPVFVAAMAEKTWEFSRPRWLHRQFGL